MGLDADLYGVRTYSKPTAAGMKGDIIVFQYWRKNWHLQTILANEFPATEQDPGYLLVELGPDELSRLLSLLGASPYTGCEGDAEKVRRAIDWCNDPDDGASRKIVYQATW